MEQYVYDSPFVVCVTRIQTDTRRNWLCVFAIVCLRRFFGWRSAFERRLFIVSTTVIYGDIKAIQLIVLLIGYFFRAMLKSSVAAMAFKQRVCKLKICTDNRSSASTRRRPRCWTDCLITRESTCDVNWLCCDCYANWNCSLLKFMAKDNTSLSNIPDFLRLQISKYGYIRFIRSQFSEY